MELKSIQNITLDTVRNQYITVTAKAGDVASRFIHIQVTNAGELMTIENNKIVIAKIKTPDNRLIELLSYETESIPKHIEILSDGTLMVQLSTGTLLSAGIAKCELEIKSGNTILSTFIFNINIAEQVYNDDDILDDSEAKSAITALIEEMNEYVLQAKSYADSVSGDIDKVKEYIETAKNYADTAVDASTNSNTYAQLSKESADNSKNYADDSLESAKNAKQSEDNAKDYSDKSAESENNSRSWAIGDNEDHTRINGIDDKNQSSQYYSLLAKKMLDEADSIYDEAKKQVADAIFTVNYETGELEYSSSVYTFSINDNGELEWEVNDK